MARNEAWLDEDLKQFQCGRGPRSRRNWLGLIGPVLRRRGAIEADVDDVVAELWKLLIYGRSRPRRKDRGSPLCERVLARTSEARPGYVCRMAVRLWGRGQRSHPLWRTLRQLAGQVLPAARELATPAAPPTRLRRGGRFDREAVTQAVAWLLAQPEANTSTPAAITGELLEAWRFELEPQAGDDAGGYEGEATTHDAQRAADRVLPTLDERARQILARLGAGLAYREIAAELGCGLATVSRSVTEVMRRLAAATDHDHQATVLALAMLQERCAAAEQH